MHTILKNIHSNLCTTTTHKLNLVVAYDFKTRAIGHNGHLPWYIPADMKFFQALTTSSDSQNENAKNIVIMGRKTWESIPDTNRPLKNRINIILTNDAGYQDTVKDKQDTYTTTWEHILQLITTGKGFGEFCIDNKCEPGKLFLIGGNEIYKLALESQLVSHIYATEIYNFTGSYDTQLIKFNDSHHCYASPFLESNSFQYRHIVYSLESGLAPHANREELNYLHLMKEIITDGATNNDRTGVGTMSLFGQMLKYNLRDTFPISTTKRLFFRAVFEELQLYLSGKTDNNILQQKNIHIWDGNTSREFLDKRGLSHYKEGDMGQTYGFNMRHYGGQYKGCQEEYPDGYGYDQLANVINLIKTDPYSRRIIIDLWDPANIDKAALPSCLCKYQFNVNVAKKELNLAIYLRSSDYFLANNWNTCTGALFVHMLCNLEGIDLTPGDLTVFMGDAHIYKSHLEQVNINLAREPYPFPKLSVKGGRKSSITDFKFEDLELVGYKAYPNIKADMAV